VRRGATRLEPRNEGRAVATSWSASSLTAPTGSGEPVGYVRGSLKSGAMRLEPRAKCVPRPEPENERTADSIRVPKEESRQAGEEQSGADAE
jgi:hypothetical protein